MLFVCHPKILHKHCFSFSWGHFNSQEKVKTMHMQNFGVANKEHYGMLWYYAVLQVKQTVVHHYLQNLYVNSDLYQYVRAVIRSFLY